jgi:parvulin-like peptidyl-prolyl isomerase
VFWLRYRSLLFLLLMSLLLTVSCGTKPVAVVNGEKVSKERFERYFTQVKTYAEQMGMSFEGEEGEKQLANLKQDALDNLIDEILIMQTGGKEGIKVSENEINDFLEQRVKNAFENKEEYLDWLESFGLTEEEFKDKIKYQLTGQKLFEKVTEQITVTDEEARKTYESDKTPWEKIKVSHILIGVERDTASQSELEQAKNTAMSLIRELDQGADFAELARKYSADPGSASLGGVLDMEFARNDQGLVKEFVEGSFALEKVGDYSNSPVLSQFGYHIIKLDAKKGSFDEVKDDLKNQLIQKEKNQAFSDYMEKIKKEAKITKNLS